MMKGYCNPNTHSTSLKFQRIMYSPLPELLVNLIFLWVYKSFCAVFGIQKTEYGIFVCVFGFGGGFCAKSIIFLFCLIKRILI